MTLAAAPKDKTSVYRQGESTIEGFERVMKLSSNESALGPSPKALIAFATSAAQLHRYPDGSHRALRAAIADVHGFNPARLVCGNGSDELISLTVRAFVRPGDEALVSENGFLMSNIHAQAQGAKLVVAPETGHRVCVDTLLASVTDKTRFCTIANPNNPTGTYITASELERLHRGLPNNCILLIDSAYAEYVECADYDAGAALVHRADNVIMTRTFSKAYGLSAARVGWAFASQRIIDAIGAIRTPFNVNGPGLAAATAAMVDQAWLAMIVRHNNEQLATITARLNGLHGLELIPSVTNFYLMRFDGNHGRNAAKAEQFLRSRGIIPRPANGAHDYLRITVGLDDENEAVLEALNAFFDAPKPSNP